MDINLIQIGVGVIVFIALWLLLTKLTFLAPYRDVLTIIIGALLAHWLVYSFW